MKAAKLTISIAEAAEGCEVEAGAGEEAADETGPALHPPEPGLHQGGQLAEIAFGQVGLPIRQGAASRRHDDRANLLTLSDGHSVGSVTVTGQILMAANTP